MKSPIGVFDSGYGGLTVLDPIVRVLPEYDFLYLGDNARTPYGTRDYEIVLEYTWQAISYLFNEGCQLVVLACNTASAKALRTIQKTRMHHFPGKNVIGVIRPTTEEVARYSTTGKIGLMGTQGTVTSMSYPIEIQKFFPEVEVYQQACPMWVPLIENSSYNSEGGNFFIKQDFERLIDRNQDIDTILLACTHYPILIPQLQNISGSKIKWISQGEIVAPKLKEYLKRHPEYDEQCSKNSTINFLTTGDKDQFSNLGSRFYNQTLKAEKINL